MKKRTAALLLFLFWLPLIAACDLLREPEAATVPIEAVPLAGDTDQEAGAGTEGDQAATEVPSGELNVAAGGRRFSISQADSQVRFELDEDLRGQRTTVVGTTNQVAGEIGLDLENPAAAQLGPVRINARTLVTDNNFRNRAIQNRILQTDFFEWITFEPGTIEGLPQQVAVGDTVTFDIAGDLTIRDQTLPAQFEVTVVVNSPDQLSGSASTVINRSNFDLRIPSVPNVANVEEEVALYIDFVANDS